MLVWVELYVSLGRGFLLVLVELYVSVNGVVC